MISRPPPEPASLLGALGLTPGETLLLHMEDERLILKRRMNIEKRIRARFAGIPKEISLVDELIAERRREALRENDRCNTP